MSTFDVGILILRLVAGLIFAGHGAQKAFGWWGGPGPAGWHGAMEHMGFRPASLFAWVSMLAELVGGILLVLGLLTPVAAALLVAQSVVIIVHAHLPKGFWNMRGGYEFPLMLGAAAVALGLVGAGSISLDHAFSIVFSDTVRVALLILGAIAGGIALAVPRLTANEGHAAGAR